MFILAQLIVFVTRICCLLNSFSLFSPDRSIQMGTELLIQATEPLAGTSWTPMLLNLRYVQQFCIICFRTGLLAGFYIGLLLLL